MENKKEKDWDTLADALKRKNPGIRSSFFTLY
jgi:hypothetical protein